MEFGINFGINFSYKNVWKHEIKRKIYGRRELGENTSLADPHRALRIWSGSCKKMPAIIHSKMTCYTIKVTDMTPGCGSCTHYCFTLELLPASRRFLFTWKASDALLICLTFFPGQPADCHVHRDRFNRPTGG